MRAGGDQVDEEEATDDDGGLGADNIEPTRQGEGWRDEGEAPEPEQQSARRSAGPHEEAGQHFNRSADQNLEHLMAISSTEKSRLAIEAQRLVIETRSLATQEAGVAQEGKRLRMDEAKILVIVESDTFKYTGVSCGAWEDMALLAMRGRSSTA